MRPERADPGPRRLVVEIAGPAGAGKSTLAAAIVAALPGSSIGQPPSRGAVAARLVLLAKPLLRARLSGIGRQWTRDELRSLGYLVAWRPHREPGLVVLDHGPVFRLATLMAFGPPMTSTPAFGRLWCALAQRWARRLDLVVLLDAGDDVLRERIDGRDRGHRIRNGPAETAERFLARSRSGLEDALSTMRGVPVLRLDTAHTSAAELVRSVHSALAPEGIRP